MYGYKVDPLTEAILPEFEDKHNHVIDALRYACEGARRSKKESAPAPAFTPRDRNWR
jgi:phage terminase large subunit